jgi:hypothetical protein
MDTPPRPFFQLRDELRINFEHEAIRRLFRLGLKATAEGGPRNLQ